VPQPHTQFNTAPEALGWGRFFCETVAFIGGPRKSQMKKPFAVNSTEAKCPECMGTGFAVIPHPTRPGVRTYQICKECRGKGRMVAD
jgi:hypothetical protein